MEIEIGYTVMDFFPIGDRIHIHIYQVNHNENENVYC